MLIYSFITDYQAFSLRYKDNTTRDKNETKVGKQSANLGKNNEPIQNRLSFLTDCKSVILHHLTILSFPMVRPAWDNWRLSETPKDFGGGWCGVWSGALGALDSQKLPNLMSIKELGGLFWIVRNLGFERIVKLRGLYWIGGNLEGRFR